MILKSDLIKPEEPQKNVSTLNSNLLSRDVSKKKNHTT